MLSTQHILFKFGQLKIAFELINALFRKVKDLKDVQLEKASSCIPLAFKLSKLISCNDVQSEKARVATLETVSGIFIFSNELQPQKTPSWSDPILVKERSASVKDEQFLKAYDSITSIFPGKFIFFKDVQSQKA